MSSQAARDYMRELPFDLHSVFGGQDINVVHGSSRTVNEYMLEDQPASPYERATNAEVAQVLVFGHAHEPWIRELGARWSLTAARSASPTTGIRASRARCLSATTPGRVAVSIERVHHDAEAAGKGLAAAGLPGEHATRWSPSPSNRTPVR